MKDLVSSYQPRQYVKDIVEGQMVSIIGGILAGVILVSRVDGLKLLPGFFILFPGFLELQGAINASLAARIGSLFHTKGLKVADELNDPLVKTNFMAALILSLVSSLFLGGLSLLLTFIIFKKIVIKLILVSSIAGIAVSLIITPLTLGASVWLYKRGHDPDNIMGPFLTSATDIISVLVLILVIGALI